MALKIKDADWLLRFPEEKKKLFTEDLVSSKYISDYITLKVGGLKKKKGVGGKKEHDRNDVCWKTVQNAVQNVLVVVFMLKPLFRGVLLEARMI